MKTKTIKKIGYAAMVLIGVVVVLNLIQSPITIENTVRVNASNEEVFAVLASYEKFPQWSPFLLTDPKQKNWVTGGDGLVGSKFHWKGVAEESEGFQELTQFDRPNLLVMQCVITVPFESKPTFRYDLSNASNATVVKQSFEMPASLFDKAMMSAFGVLKEISETNKLGMSRLKTYVESNEVAS